MQAADACSPVALLLQTADESKPEQEEGELVEVIPEPTDEELLAQLGLQLEQRMADLTANDALPAAIMQQWAEEEQHRDAAQWQPKRESPGEAVDEAEEEEGAEIVGFPDVKGSMLGPREC